MSTIVIIDDDPRFRGQIAALLEGDGFSVLGEAADGATGVEAARALLPEFVLVDIGLPDIDGFEVARRLPIDGWRPLVVLTSSRDARAYGARLTDDAWQGFLPKELISGAALRAAAGQD